MRKACSSGAVPLLVEPDRAKRYRMFEFVPKPLDDLVPAGHLLRRLESCIDFRLLAAPLADRKSTRLNSSHVKISYAVFCLKKKTSLRPPDPQDRPLPV